MSTSFATIDDFIARYSGSVLSAEEPRIERLLEDASTLIREAVDATYLDDEGVLEDDFPVLFVIVCVEAARRAYDNPMALDGETIGNYSWRSGYRGAGGTTAGSLYLTAGELKALRKAAGKTGVISVGLSSDLPYISTSESDLW